jgi:phospholipase/lecithinase/hemolysin
LEFQVIDEAFSTLPQEILIARAQEEGMDVLDLLSAYRVACDEKPDGPCELEDRYLFADVWMHPSAVGHELAAQEITKVLETTLAGE